MIEERPHTTVAMSDHPVAQRPGTDALNPPVDGAIAVGASWAPRLVVLAGAAGAVCVAGDDVVDPEPRGSDLARGVDL